VKVIKNILTNNFMLKVIALVLAMLTWSYIGGQLYKQSIAKGKEAPSIIKVSGEKLIVKTLPIYVNIEGNPAPGYRIVLDKIVTNPSNSVVAGPPEVIKELSYITTQPVVIEAANSTVKRNLELSPIPNCKIGYEGKVRIAVPIVRIKRK